MSKLIKSINFRVELVREYSMSPIPESLGIFDNQMDLMMNDDKSGYIEWTFAPIDSDEQDVEYIGLYFEGNELTDYDGIFSLPEQAIELIRSAGYIVDESFI